MLLDLIHTEAEAFFVCGGQLSGSKYIYCIMKMG
jgi:hypothetical protein